MRHTQSVHVLSRAVIVQDDHLLCAYDPQTQPQHYYQHGAFFYYLPGGHIDCHESAHDAVVRELQEEIGHHAVVERFLGTLEHAWTFPGDNICCHTHELNLFFKVHIPSLHRSHDLPQQEAHVAFSWIPMAELNTVDLRPHALKTLIPLWLATDRDEAFQSTLEKGDQVYIKLIS